MIPTSTIFIYNGVSAQPTTLTLLVPNPLCRKMINYVLILQAYGEFFEQDVRPNVNDTKVSILNAKS
jgi:hypothetical protein